MVSALGRKTATLAFVTVLVAVRLPAVQLIAVGVDFPFDRMYGTYENVEIETLPMSNGAIRLQLSSPKNTVTLESGHLHLEPAEDGLHKAVLQVAFSGEGRLITEVRIGTIPARFEDQVRFPSQEHMVTAWVAIEAVEDGYRIVTEELPETLQIELESSRAADLVRFCRQMSLFFAGDAGCEQLESMLSNPQVPLPRPGSDFLVRRSALSESERRRLDLYLAGSSKGAQ